jgi:hypothetical protein
MCVVCCVWLCVCVFVCVRPLKAYNHQQQLLLPLLFAGPSTWLMVRSIGSTWTYAFATATVARAGATHAAAHQVNGSEELCVRGLNWINPRDCNEHPAGRSFADGTPFDLSRAVAVQMCHSYRVVSEKNTFSFCTV